MNREALIDIEILNRGEMPKPRETVGPEYLAFRQKYMLSPEYQKLTPLVKQLHIESLRMAAEDAKRYMQLLATQPPTPEEMQAQNMQAVEQAEMEGAVAQAQPENPMEQATQQVAQGVDKNNQLLQKQQQKPQKPVA